jgi:predicted permease
LSQTLPIVFSIFGLIALGYGAARSRLLGAHVGRGLLDFVFHIAIPVLLFTTLANADLQGLSPWRIWAAYFVPFALVWALSDAMIRRVFGRDARAGVVAGSSAAFANSVLFAIPLIQAAYGDIGTVYLIVVISIHLAVMMVASLILNKRAMRTDGMDTEQVPRREALGRFALALLKHPILIAILAGALWRLTGQPIPQIAALVLEPLARSAGALALFASGMALVDFGVARQVRPALAVAALKLLAMPALVFVAARLFGLPPIGVAAITLTAAGPTGVNVFLIATQLGTGQALASNAVLFSTAGSVVTVALWLTVLGATLP